MKWVWLSSIDFVYVAGSKFNNANPRLRTHSSCPFYPSRVTSHLSPPHRQLDNIIAAKRNLISREFIKESLSDPTNLLNFLLLSTSHRCERQSYMMNCGSSYNIMNGIFISELIWRLMLSDWRNNGGIMCWSMFGKFYFIKGHRRHMHVCRLSFENSLNSCSVLNVKSWVSESLLRNEQQKFADLATHRDLWYDDKPWTHSLLSKSRNTRSSGLMKLSKMCIRENMELCE